MAKIGRNQPCSCGSGKKYKRCHGAFDAKSEPPPLDIDFAEHLSKAEEHIRQHQQGRGKPIIAFRSATHQIVAVGNTVHWSDKWKTFPDFLIDYMKGKLGADWIKAEAAKPAADQHPLMQWAHHNFEYQKATIKTPGQVANATVTGIVACFLGTAYALYLLDHNVELQARLLNRLKDVGQFQGAYYELFVASALIRAGFKLTLEDETDGNSKHCEFAAISAETGTRYWVEAKMRAVRNMLGRTNADGGPDARPLARLIPHLNDALAKPAKNERLIFIDVNTPVKFAADGTPDWLEPAMQRLEWYEKTSNKPGVRAFVFVTNVAFHRDLDGQPILAVSPFGLGFPDFNRPGMINVKDAYRQKEKYIDAHSIFKSLQNYLLFPTTFDGTLPSEAFGQPSARVKIGETYHFPDAGITGVVTAATVDEQNRQIFAAVSNDKQHVMLKVPMSESDLVEWKEYGEAFFGRVPSGTSSHPKNEFELFEWLMETQKNVPREKLISWFPAGTPHLEEMTDQELRMAYCEWVVASLPKN